MSGIYQTVKSFVYKSSAPIVKPAEEEEVSANPDDIKEKAPEYSADNKTDDIKEKAPEYSADKKTDEDIEPPVQHGILWRMSSGVYSTATGAVGLGVGGVKWAAGKGYDVGHSVVSKVKVPSLPRLRSKDKKE